ncbi:hypothetical protein ES703_00352 [subsurface metagenome]
MLTKKEGRKIAEQLGLRYDGIQDLRDKPAQYQFTDIAATGTTFYGNTLEKAKEKLIEKRQLFGAKLPLWAQKELADKKAMEEASRLYKPPMEIGSLEEKAGGLLPMSPESGPPLPRMFSIKWPWKK